MFKYLPISQLRANVNVMGAAGGNDFLALYYVLHNYHVLENVVKWPIFLDFFTQSLLCGRLSTHILDVSMCVSTDKPLTDKAHLNSILKEAN